MRGPHAHLPGPAARNVWQMPSIATSFGIEMIMLVSSPRREMRSAGGEMSECPARARTASYMNISISSGQPSGKWLILAHGVQMPWAVMMDEARDPADIALFRAVGIVLEAKHLPNLIEQLHGVILWREYRDMRAVARDAR